jgi:drug/metabolite transporter superfamily protein YnfA
MDATDDSKRREIEINEWNYHSKMETLFILQLFFIGFAATIILLTLSKYGFFSRLYAFYTGVVVTAVLVIIAIVKRLYTKNVRDKRFWNGRVFAGDETLASLVPPAVLAATATTNQQICAASKGKTVPGLPAATPAVAPCV